MAKQEVKSLKTVENCSDVGTSIASEYKVLPHGTPSNRIHDLIRIHEVHTSATTHATFCFWETENPADGF